MKKQIAIDGPAGAGKSTIAKIVAGELGFIYVDTGAMYRTMALYFDRNGIDPGDERAIDAAVPGADIALRNEAGSQRIFLAGEDVTDEIRTQRIGDLASATSKYASVRTRLTNLQREIAEAQPVVMDGRDIGTTVLPDAVLKVYLTASARTRAERRYRELIEKGETGIDLDAIEAEITARDEQDMTREISPLCKADDAVEVDSSHMGIREVADAVMRLYRERA